MPPTPAPRICEVARFERSRAGRREEEEARGTRMGASPRYTAARASPLLPRTALDKLNDAMTTPALPSAFFAARSAAALAASSWTPPPADQSSTFDNEASALPTPGGAGGAVDG